MMFDPETMAWRAWRDDAGCRAIEKLNMDRTIQCACEAPDGEGAERVLPQREDQGDPEGAWAAARRAEIDELKKTHRKCGGHGEGRTRERRCSELEEAGGRCRRCRRSRPCRGIISIGRGWRCRGRSSSKEIRSHRLHEETTLNSDYHGPGEDQGTHSRVSRRAPAW